MTDVDSTLSQNVNAFARQSTLSGKVPLSVTSLEGTPGFSEIPAREDHQHQLGRISLLIGDPNVTIEGGLIVQGAISGNSLTVSGSISAASAGITGNLTAGSINAGAATFTGVLTPNGGIASHIVLRQGGANEGAEIGFEGGTSYPTIMYLDRYNNDFRFVTVGGNIVSIASGNIDATYINLTNAGAGVQLRSTVPTIIWRDTDHCTGYIHVNANIMYVLTGPADSAYGAWGQVANSRWPMEINLTNNDITLGGTLNVASSSGCTIKSQGTAAGIELHERALDGNFVTLYRQSDVFRIYDSRVGDMIQFGWNNYDWMKFPRYSGARALFMQDGSWLRTDLGFYSPAQIETGNNFFAANQIISGKQTGTWYNEQNFYCNPTAVRCGVGWHPGGVAGSLAMIQSNPSFHFGDIGGGGYYPIWAASFNVSSRRFKQDIVPWPPKSLGAAAPTAVSIVDQIEIVEYRRKAEQMLKEAPYTERRENALRRLNDYADRSNKPRYELPMHVCAVEKCGHTPDDPCIWITNWEKPSIGYTAEQLMEVFPQAVHHDTEGLPTAVASDTLLSLALKSIQELNQRVRQLEEEKNAA